VLEEFYDILEGRGIQILLVKLKAVPGFLLKEGILDSSSFCIEVYK
jgi:hypothetical protein